jgi:colanic acid/amylovoran biosynthesis protein
VRLFLSGQTSCDNRGSAAIVESTMRLFAAAEPAATFAMPAWDPAQDRRDLPEEVAARVELVPLPRGNRFVTHLRRYRPGARTWLASGLVMRLVPPAVRRAIDAADAVLSVGGDLYAGDYGFPVVVYAQDAYALARGKPVYLWGASLGEWPAGSRRLLAAHLERFERLFLRDGLSLARAAELVPRARTAPTLDPAFTLPPASFDFDGPARFDLGLNLSGLAFNLKGVTDRRTQGRVLERLLAAFGAATGIAAPEVLLLPHVFRAGDDGDDHHFLDALQRAYAGPARLTLAPRGRRAGEYKWLLGRCGAVVAARTHVTIAAFSQGVPTLSVAYSLKARGLNRDIFGHERFCHAADALLDADLASTFAELDASADALRARLRAYKAEGRERLDAAVAEVRDRVAGARVPAAAAND